jgi:hypothetical protein
MISVIGFIQFPFVSSIAMFFYPGGNGVNLEVQGYSFFYNFFSDLGRTTAINGQLNLIPLILFIVTISILGTSLAMYYLITQFLCESLQINWYLTLFGTILGVLSGLGFFGIIITPVDLYPFHHLFFALITFLLLILASFFRSLTLYYSERYPKKYSMIFLFFTAIFSIYFAIYLIIAAISQNFVPVGLLIQVTGQKIVFYALIVCYSLQIYKTWKIISKI